jgi:hypothetical protein
MMLEAESIKLVIKLVIKPAMLQIRHNSQQAKGLAGMRDAELESENSAKSGASGNPTIN